LTAESTPVGSLARELREARADLQVVRHRVSTFLESLFPGWRPRFPISAGWAFTHPDAIDVYSIVPSPAAVDALRRAGFRVVTLHEHEATRVIACSCKPEPEPKPSPGSTP
jgi:hypothetical protein